MGRFTELKSVNHDLRGFLTKNTLQKIVNFSSKFNFCSIFAFKPTMEEFELTSYESKGEKIDELHIGKKSVTSNLSAFKYQDKDTNQYIIYIPSLEISGYGETKEKSEEMIHHALKDFCKYLTGLSSKDQKEELRKLGWRKHKIKNTDYSKSYIDLSGELKGFAVNEIVEEESITA